MKFYIEVAAATVLALAFAVPSSADDDIGDSATGKIEFFSQTWKTTKGRLFPTCWMGIAKSMKLCWEGGKEKAFRILI